MCSVRFSCSCSSCRWRALTRLSPVPLLLCCPPCSDCIPCLRSQPELDSGACCFLLDPWSLARLVDSTLLPGRLACACCGLVFDRSGLLVESLHTDIWPYLRSVVARESWRRGATGSGGRQGEGIAGSPHSSYQPESAWGAKEQGSVVCHETEESAARVAQGCS